MTATTDCLRDFLTQLPGECCDNPEIPESFRALFHASRALAARVRDLEDSIALPEEYRDALHLWNTAETEYIAFCCPRCPYLHPSLATITPRDFLPPAVDPLPQPQTTPPLGPELPARPVPLPSPLRIRLEEIEDSLVIA